MTAIGAQDLAKHLQHCAIALHPMLLEMLQEHFSHQSERRGCGFTQATRWLALMINRARSALDLKELSGNNAEPNAAAWQLALQSFYAQSEGEALLARILQDVLFPQAHSEPTLTPIAPEKLKIGTCPLAEQFFLEVACDRIRRGGYIHIICHGDGTPLLLEKRGLGDDHSAITVAPTQIFGVRLPPGTLVGLQYDDEVLAQARACKNQRGVIIPASLITQFRYLRLTTLAVSATDRRRNFSLHFEQQLQNNLFLPDTTEISQLRAFAERQL